jgi:hypothetical protein
VEELHTRWRYIMTAMVKCISGVAVPNLQRIMIYIKVSLCYSTTIVVHRNLTWRSLTVHNARRSMKLKCSFARYCF